MEGRYKLKSIFIDADNVLWNATAIVTDILNYMYDRDVKWQDVRKYNFIDAFPEVTKTEIKIIFESDLFFSAIPDFIFKDAKDVISRLCGDFKVYVITIGTPKNIQMKIDVLKREFPFIKNYIMIVKDDNVMDKSIVNMKKEDILIDDVYSNLESSSAGNRILFSSEGIKTSWNEYGKYIELTPSWKDVERRIYGE